MRGVCRVSVRNAGFVLGCTFGNSQSTSSQRIVSLWNCYFRQHGTKYKIRCWVCFSHARASWCTPAPLVSLGNSRGIPPEAHREWIQKVEKEEERSRRRREWRRGGETRNKRRPNRAGLNTAAAAEHCVHTAFSQSSEEQLRLEKCVNSAAVEEELNTQRTATVLIINQIIQLSFLW